jgi:hypothetical protein
LDLSSPKIMKLKEPVLVPVEQCPKFSFEGMQSHSCRERLVSEGHSQGGRASQQCGPQVCPVNLDLPVRVEVFGLQVRLMPFWPMPGRKSGHDG